MAGYDWYLPARLYLDASGFGIGLLITQKRPEGEVPIVFGSKALTKLQRAHPPYKYELYEIGRRVDGWP